MLHRRSFCFCGSCALIATLVHSSDISASEAVAFGCTVSPDEIESMGAPNAPPKDLAKKIVKIFGNSENENFDRSLGKILAMMAADFEVKPGFGFYEDGVHHNARAWDQAKISGTQHGTIAFGASFLRSLLSMRDGDIAVAAVCAHEFGHVYQYKSGYYGHLLKNTPGFCLELHADYLAGWFLAKLKSRRPTIKLRQAGIVIEGLGSSDFSIERFHGRPDQRKHAIERGFFDCKGSNFSMTIDIAAKSGFDYLWEKYTN